MAERFYVNCSLAPGPVELSGPEAHHLATVCRIRPGQQVCLFNGDSREYLADVVAVERRAVGLEVIAVGEPQRELPFRLIVAAPLPKGDRAQFLIEKLTELGVTAFIPVQTRRSIVAPREAKLDKLRRWVIEASKQCGRNVLMDVEEWTEWAAVCDDTKLPPLRMLAHPGAASLPGAKGQDVAVAVGPEGGFTEEEIERAVTAGWQLVRLGTRILRVETAAVALAARLVLTAE